MGTNDKLWVTMTDKFMSGWGRAERKINKLVVECDNGKQAELIKKNAENRPEMKNINICVTQPRYNNNNYIVSYKKFAELGGLWVR